jgi:PRTRC genetic system protein C
MPTTARSIVRVFLYNGITLEDPLPGKPLESVRRVHGTQYSAITNAKVDGPEYQGNREVYTYRTQVGVNG